MSGRATARRDPAHPLARWLATRPPRWRGAGTWTVLDLDWAFGERFLAVLAAWRADPHRPATLRYAALRREPLTRDALAARWSAGTMGAGVLDAAVRRDLDALRCAWPPALTGVHRLDLAEGRVQLWLAVGPPRRTLPRWLAAVDVALADAGGPCPPEPALLRTACAALAAPGELMLANADGAALQAATGAGLHLQPVDGMALHRGVRIRGPASVSSAVDPARRHALVIGAGLAGSAVTQALLRRGWRVELLGHRPTGRHRPESDPAPASGQPALAHHPSVTPDDAPLSRLTRAAALLARTAYDSPAIRWTGRLQLMSPDLALRCAAALPADWVEALDAGPAAERAGLALHSGGLWLPAAGVADPAALCRDWSAGARHRRWRGPVATLARGPNGWHAFDAHGALLGAAPSVVVATGAGDLGVALHTDTGLRTVGLLAHLGLDRADARRPGWTVLADTRGAAPLRCILGGDGHAMPLADGRLVVGPLDDDTRAAADPGVALRDVWLRHAARLRDPPPMPRLRAAGSGLRLSCRDHLPLAGSVEDDLHVAAAFGGRGLLWAVLAAEIVAAGLDGEPGPVEPALLRALDPCRFRTDATLQRLRSVDRPSAAA